MRIRNLNLLLVGIILCSGCTAMKSRFSKTTSLPAVASESVSATARNSAGAETKPLPDFEAPEKMLAVWKDSVRTEDNGLSMRGFGGRLYLYDDDGLPIRAEGDLVIYGFDDSVTEREGSKADRKIVIANEQFQKRYSESALGPSYSVWVSWDRVGSPNKSVTLVPFFRTTEGKIVQAGQAIYTLHTPGMSDDLSKEKISSLKQVPRSIAEEGVSQVSYLEGDVESIQQENRSSNTVRTTTISLPRETQKRLQASDFGSRQRSQVNEITQSVADGNERQKRPSRLEEARKKRRLELDKGKLFGMPGEL